MKESPPFKTQKDKIIRKLALVEIERIERELKDIRLLLNQA